MTMEYTFGKEGQGIAWTMVMDAPREEVFKAYIDPALVPQWQGPRRIESKVEELDARPGGKWRVVSHDPEGNEYDFHGVFHEVIPPERMVRTNEYEGAPGHVSLETVTFDERDGKTYIAIHAVYCHPEDRDAMMQSGMEEGVRESVERLSELVEKPKAA